MSHADPLPSIAASALPVEGEIVSDKYRIEAMLAEGGMGVVYLATHLQLDERVAIKFLRTEYTGPQAGELPGRFIREARTSSKIKSEHVVRVHDVGSADNGVPYIVMEFLTGKDLDRLVCEDGAMPIPQAVDYVLQACEALAEAHDLGIVHRDLKPANLFLIHRADGSPCVKVLDFGISKFNDGAGNTRDFGITKTHAVMGSPRYMSPEQMRSSKNVDARADIWAIGIILYELLAGTVPFDGDAMPQICAAILEQSPKSLRVLRPEISSELEAIVGRCLAKNAEDRFANVAHLAHALSPWGSSEAWASADRIARVLGVSGSNVAAAPAPSPRPISAPPAAISRPLPPIERARDRAGTSDAPGIEVGWTGFDEMRSQITRRRRATLAALAASAMIVSGVVGAAVSMTHRPRPVETTAAVLRVEPRSALMPPAIASVIPPPAVVAPLATVEPIAEPTPMPTSRAPKTKPAAKHTSHVSPPSPASPAVTTTSTTTATTATTSEPVSESDMWGERK